MREGLQAQRAALGIDTDLLDERVEQIAALLGEQRVPDLVEGIELIRQTQATGKLIPAAHLAALAVEHQLVLCSTDGDFARFPSLRLENALQ